jgi:peptidoglycan/LPS O-acetylase OafA/YrhL
MQLNGNRIPTLDGLRAIAISLVIVCHFGRDIGFGDPGDLGSLGVRIFFVISGFLITLLLLNESEKTGRISLLRFYFRRTARIFPAFYFYLAVMLVLGWIGWADLSFGGALPALTYTSNYTVEPLKQLVAHTWSLSTEEQFYLIWPAILLIAGRRRAPYALFVLMIAAAFTARVLTARLGVWVPAFFNTPIGTGCMLALLRDSAHRNVVYRAWVGSSLGFLLPALIVIANLPSLHSGSLNDALLSWMENVVIALWIDWTISNASRSGVRVLNQRWVVAIGVGSYSLYLWQQPFMGLWSSQPGLLLGGSWHILSSPLPRFLMVAACAAGSYLLVERPVLRLRGRIESVLFGTSKRKPVPQVVTPRESTGVDVILEKSEV